MGRAIRMVPANWEHPRDEHGEYIPLLDHFPYIEEEIEEGLKDGWLTDDPPNYGCDLMPTWSEAEKTHYQLYETTTEGMPISPVFDNIDDLCAYAAEHCTTFADLESISRRMEGDALGRLRAPPRVQHDLYVTPPPPWGRAPGGTDERPKSKLLA